MIETILNGAPSGNVAAKMLACNFDTGMMRPWLGEDGRSYVTLKSGRFNIDKETGRITPIYNTFRLSENVATLRRDEWLAIDRAVVEAAQPRLRVVSDLRGAGLTYDLPNAMGKTVLETQVMGTISPATMSMDGIRESMGDRPVFDYKHTPIPITHYDFSFTARDIAVSRNGGIPLDTTMAQMAGEQVGILVEQTTLGVAPGEAFQYAGGIIYGLTTFPQRNTKVLTNPTLSAWAPATTANEVLAMKQQSIADRQYGPWVLYTSPNWEQYLDKDYSAAYPGQTLRKRLKEIEGITDIRQSDYLSGYRMILVQMNARTIRIVVGMEITTLQWDTHGGMRQNFKVMAIMVPQLRADISGNSGIVDGAAA